MQYDLLHIHSNLHFLSPSLRLQYTNFIYKFQKNARTNLTLEEIIERIKKEEPIEYIFNIAEFYGNIFYVDNRCLIPRPETEEIVRKTIDYASEHLNEVETIVDVGTGSGCIILSIAKELSLKFPNLKLKYFGIDISKEALEVAERNRNSFNLQDKVNFINKSFESFDFSTIKNAIICSNLPYIPDNEELQKSVIDYEPHAALFGGEVGDELNKKLYQQLENMNNIKALFMEGYNGEVTTHFINL